MLASRGVVSLVFCCCRFPLVWMWEERLWPSGCGFDCLAFKYIYIYDTPPSALRTGGQMTNRNHSSNQK